MLNDKSVNRQRLGPVPIQQDIQDHLEHELGTEGRERYWTIQEQLFETLGYRDYLGALQRYRVEHPREPHLLQASLYLLHYPFASRLYPRALDVIRRLRESGPVVILTDGDVVFQPHKVERSGIWEAVAGEVLIFIHKEQVLDEVERRHPAHRYVMIDDKLRILAAIKDVWRDRVTTVFVRQGHYAHDPAQVDPYPPADVEIDAIGALTS